VRRGKRKRKRCDTARAARAAWRGAHCARARRPAPCRTPRASCARAAARCRAVGTTQSEGVRTAFSWGVPFIFVSPPIVRSSPPRRPCRCAAWLAGAALRPVQPRSPQVLCACGCSTDALATAPRGALPAARACGCAWS
jgi:hypothetical protein